MADTDLTGHKVLAIVSNYGIEQDELKVPMQHLTDAGAQVDVAAVSTDTIQTLVGDKDPGETFEPTTTLDDGKRLRPAHPRRHDQCGQPAPGAEGRGDRERVHRRRQARRGHLPRPCGRSSRPDR